MHTPLPINEDLSNKQAFNSKIIREFQSELDLMFTLHKTSENGHLSKQDIASVLYATISEMLLNGLPGSASDTGKKTHMYKLTSTLDMSETVAFRLCTLAYDRVCAKNLINNANPSANDRALTFLATYCNSDFLRFLSETSTGNS